MTDQLDTGSISDLIIYRLQRANETLEEADYNAKGGYFNTAINRLYYACYYAASALMLANELSATTHKGIKTLLSLNFVKTGIIDPKYGRIYQQLFENRQSGDYEDFVYCDQNMFNELRPEAEDFIKTITALIS